MSSISLGDKYTLSIKEAASYFGIGQKKMRRLADENLGEFSIRSGNKYLVIREKFEEYLRDRVSI